MLIEYLAYPPPTDESNDRRWYPVGNPVEWAHTTREQIFQAVTRCIGHALDNPYASFVADQTFLELHNCVSGYACGLYALGQTEEGVVALVFEAAKHACHPGELHPAIVAALGQWCREAHASRTALPPVSAGEVHDPRVEKGWSRRRGDRARDP
jgi:hypothetical protein